MAITKQYIIDVLLLLAGAAAAIAATMPTQCTTLTSTAPDPQAATSNPQTLDAAAVTQEAIDQLAAGRFDKAETLALSLINQPDGTDSLPPPDHLISADNPQSGPWGRPQGCAIRNPQSSCRPWAIVAAARERAGKHASALRAYRLFLASCQDPQTRQYITQRIDACRDALRGTGVSPVSSCGTGVPPVSSSTDGEREEAEQNHGQARGAPDGDAHATSPAEQNHAQDAYAANLESASHAPATQPSVAHGLSPGALHELAKVEQESTVESSEHFVVHARNPRLAKLVTQEAEATLARICSDLLAGEEYSHSVEIDVYADHDDYIAHAADAPEWSGGAFTFQVKDGQTIRKISLTQLDKDGRFATIMLDRVLPHEMCHLVVTEYFGDAACPLFLNEGLAMLAETGVDNDRVALAGAALAGRKQIKLDQLFVGQRQDMDSGAVKPEVFYAESYSFLSYLHARLNRQQFGAFVEHMKDGCTVADSLQRALFVPADDDFIPQLWSAWTEVAISQAQDLHALKGDLSMRD